MRYNREKDTASVKRTEVKGAPEPSMPMKTSGWPGVPGKTQPRDRSGGVKKPPVHVKQEGL